MNAGQTPRAHRLSKSRFCTGVQCPKALYLSVHESGLAAPVDEAKQRIFDQGTEVGIEARKRYPDGHLIDHDYRESEEAIVATANALEEGKTILFEAAFLYHNTLVRIDILKRNEDGTWDIIEVKSSTSCKDEYIPDLAIQRYVAEGCGLKIAHTYLKHLNNQCKFPDLSNLFTDVDCTDKVNKLLPSVPSQVDNLLQMLEKNAAPQKDIGPHCDTPYDCNFIDHCWQHIPEHSVFELNGVWATTKFELYREGIIRITDIPEDRKVSRAKLQQLEAVRSGKPVIDKKGLKQFLSKLQYPLYFLDFESINLAIPQHEGLWPYAQLVFQYSCHVLEREGSELQHCEYLADGTGDPRTEVADGLIKDLGKSGSIIVYNQSFEKTRIKELAKQLPSVRNELLDLIPRLVDLKDAFSKYYCHPEFHGSFSIKDVLPVLVPEMTYEGLPVADGGGAQVAYLKLFDVHATQQEREQIRKHLIEYCRQDTLAMVELINRLDKFT